MISESNRMIDDLLILPDHFPEAAYDFSQNPLTKEKIELGRALFYDPLLSSDNSISCASCHSPYNSFAHTDHALSHGISDSIGNRNAPALFNLAWHESFNWDGAINHLDMQALAPIEDEKEMNMDFTELIPKLQTSDLYPELFLNAFGDSTVTGEHTLKSLAQFQLTLVSANSKFDQVQRGILDYAESERKGEALFMNHCNACHTAPLFTNNTFKNNGLKVDNELNDVGRYTLTKNPKDSLTFKVPSLRNLSYTYPYMHDGRFSTLREVLQHYNNGISSSATLANELEGGIKLTDAEMTEIIAFLLTLNDQEFVFNPTNKFPKNILLNN